MPREEMRSFPLQHLGEAKANRGVSHSFRERSRLCCRPFHVPCRCFHRLRTRKTTDRENPRKIGKTTKNWGQKLNTTFFCSNFSGAAGISRQNPGISRQKSLISLVSRDIPNFLPPTPACGRPLPHRKRSDQKVWVWVPFSCLKKNRESPKKDKKRMDKFRSGSPPFETLPFGGPWNTPRRAIARRLRVTCAAVE